MSGPRAPGIEREAQARCAVTHWHQNYGKSAFAFQACGEDRRTCEYVWARAPYLDNGSVPRLWIFQPEDCRPPKFRRGSDVYDPVNLGVANPATLIARRATR